MKPVVHATVLVSKEHVNGAIVENHNELVRVFALDHWLEPADMLNFARLFHLSFLVVLDDNAFVFQLWVIAAYRARLSAHQHLDLRLVPATDLVLELVVAIRVLAIQVGCRAVRRPRLSAQHRLINATRLLLLLRRLLLSLLLHSVRDAMLEKKRSEVVARLAHF